MVAYTAQRLQTNAAWSAQFTFTGVDISSWTMTGRAKSTKNATKYVDLSITGGQIVIDDGANGKFSVTLSDTETAQLGEGQIVFEVMRTVPTPKRPVLRFTVNSYLGVAT